MTERVRWGVRRGVDNRPHHFRRPSLADRVRDDAPRPALDGRDDICGLFLSPDEGEQLIHLQRPGCLGLRRGGLRRRCVPVWLKPD